MLFKTILSTSGIRETFLRMSPMSRSRTATKVEQETLSKLPRSKEQGEHVVFFLQVPKARILRVFLFAWT